MQSALRICANSRSRNASIDHRICDGSKYGVWDGHAKLFGGLAVSHQALTTPMTRRSLNAPAKLCL